MRWFLRTSMTMASASDISAIVAKLKDEGNALFTKKDYRSAYHTYTKALELDDKNVILYANRAACSQNTKK